MARLSGLKGTGSQVWPRWTWKASQIHCENDSHNVFKRHFLSNCKNPLNFYQAFFQLKVFKRCLDSFQLLIKQNDAKWIIRYAHLPIKIESRWRYWKSAVAAVAGQEVYSRQKGRRWSPMSPGSIFVIQMFEFPSWKLLVLQMLRVFRYFSYYHDWLNLFSNHETNQKQTKKHLAIIYETRERRRPQKVSQYLGIDSSSTMADESVPETKEFHEIVFVGVILRKDTVRIDKIWLRWPELKWTYHFDSDLYSCARVCFQWNMEK